jgi:uncharacterized protein (DUF433 family)
MVASRKSEKRVVVDPTVFAGEPCIWGTRIPVAVIVDSLTEGLTPAQVVDHYPSLTEQDIKAAVVYMRRRIDRNKNKS